MTRKRRYITIGVAVFVGYIISLFVWLARTIRDEFSDPHRDWDYQAEYDALFGDTDGEE